jgi:hypothetical protein
MNPNYPDTPHFYVKAEVSLFPVWFLAGLLFLLLCLAVTRIGLRLVRDKLPQDKYGYPGKYERRVPK